MILRDYQAEAIGQTYRYLKENPDKNPLLVLPTGAGKTPVIAQICLDAIKWGRRVLITSHRKELLEQNKKHALFHDELEGKVGLYSAGLGYRDTDHPIIVAGIQSVYKRLQSFKPFDLMLVDEAHLVSEREDSMYQFLLDSAGLINPNVRLVGLTATPYRTGTGYMCGPKNTFNDIAYEVCVKKLIDDGYLSPLKSKGGDSSSVIGMGECRAVRGDYTESDMEERALADGMVSRSVRDILIKAEGRKKILVFSVNVAHGQEICSELRKRCGDDAAHEVYGDTIDRAEIIKGFADNEEARFLINCNVLTTGFDYPAIDCVVLLRPTVSPGLYYQMVGRGLRLDPAKTDCLVLDYGENILRHGPLNQIDPGVALRPGQFKPTMKECRVCSEVVMSSHTVCPECGTMFPAAPEREVSHETRSSDADIMGDNTKEEVVGVNSVSYSVWEKRDNDTGDVVSRTMRVDYRYKIVNKVSEWVCIEHSGFAGKKAYDWWQERSSGPFPCDVDDAVERAQAGELKEPIQLTIKTGGRFGEIVDYNFDEVMV